MEIPNDPVVCSEACTICVLPNQSQRHTKPDKVFVKKKKKKDKKIKKIKDLVHASAIQFETRLSLGSGSCED